MLDTHYLVAFVAGLWAAWALYQWMPVPAAVDRAALSRVMASGDEEEKLPFWRVLLLPFNRLAQKLPPTLVGQTGKQLYWAQFQGRWMGWTVVEFWGLRIAVALIGLAVGLVVLGDAFLALVVPAIGHFYLGVKLDTPAKKATRQLQRELPEVAQTLALLIATGKSEAEALREASRGKGVIHEWIRRVLATRTPDRPLFSDVRGSRRGYLREEAERARAPALVNFATQLDFLKTAGIGADVLLGNLADTVAGEFAAQANQRAEALGDKLVPVVMVFYFIPYLVGLLAPLFVGSIGMMR